jgi:hypothetical protein
VKELSSKLSADGGAGNAVEGGSVAAAGTTTGGGGAQSGGAASGDGGGEGVEGGAGGTLALTTPSPELDKLVKDLVRGTGVAWLGLLSTPDNAISEV